MCIKTATQSADQIQVSAGLRIAHNPSQLHMSLQGPVLIMNWEFASVKRKCDSTVKKRSARFEGVTDAFRPNSGVKDNPR